MPFLARRTLHSALLMIGVSLLSFTFLELAPGDYFSGLLADPNVSSETVAAMRSRHAEDQPFPLRYFRWASSALRGEFGTSLAYNAPAGPLLLERAGNTLLLTITATILSWSIALVIGVWSVVGDHVWRGRIIGGMTSSLIVIPDMLLALVLLWLALQTHLLPVGGMTSPGPAAIGYGARLADLSLHLFLPVLVLVAGSMPVLTRHLRSSLLEVFRSPFIAAARAHGITPRRIMLCYALPAAANPLISLLGFSIAGLLSTSMVVEVILGWPGIGPLLLEAVLARDVNMVMGGVMLSSCFVIAGNLLADVLLYASDPRIRRSA